MLRRDRAATRHPGGSSTQLTANQLESDPTAPRHATPLGPPSHTADLVVKPPKSERRGTCGVAWRGAAQGR